MSYTAGIGSDAWTLPTSLPDVATMLRTDKSGLKFIDNERSNEVRSFIQGFQFQKQTTSDPIRGTLVPGLPSTWVKDYESQGYVVLLSYKQLGSVIVTKTPQVIVDNSRVGGYAILIPAYESGALVVAQAFAIAMTPEDALPPPKPVIDPPYTPPSQPSPAAPAVAPSHPSSTAQASAASSPSWLVPAMVGVGGLVLIGLVVAAQRRVPA